MSQPSKSIIIFAPQKCLNTKDADDDQIPVAAVAGGQQWEKEFLCKDNLKDSSVSATKYRKVSDSRGACCCLAEFEAEAPIREAIAIKRERLRARRVAKRKP